VSATDVDWAAAAAVAERLGVHTRNLVDAGDPEPVIAWALQQSTANTGTRAISYYELASLAGYERSAAEEDAHRGWRELLGRVERLAATVKAKADAEAKATEAEAAAAEEQEEEEPS
jgi:hypothetical protein